jgi:hypothetical protein
MTSNKIQQFKLSPPKTDETAAREQRAKFEMYQAFMVGYVRRINEASFNVTIGGVRIGSAKYSRLAQINLQSRIITFSRFAVENVPERGRRYLVLHELAHVKEANHNKRFWQHVERYEPEFKRIGQELESAFKKNVRQEHQKSKDMSFASSFHSSSDELRISASKMLLNHKLETACPTSDSGVIQKTKESALIDTSDLDYFECLESDFSDWDASEPDGIINGGDYSFTPSHKAVVHLEEPDFLQLKLPFS